MNTYSKFCPNVYVARCSEQHEKGEIITLTTKYGKEHECQVHNLVNQKDGYYYYSITRTDGYNSQKRAENKAFKYTGHANNAEKRSNQYYEAAQEGRDFLSLGEPIKVGHHSENSHRNLIQRNWNRMGKSVAESKKADTYTDKAAFWEEKAKEINLSMPESLEYFTFKLEEATKIHTDLKSGKIERSHSYSLTYAKKEVNELKKKVQLAQKLWA